MSLIDSTAPTSMMASPDTGLDKVQSAASALGLSETHVAMIGAGAVISLTLEEPTAEDWQSIQYALKQAPRGAVHLRRFPDGRVRVEVGRTGPRHFLLRALTRMVQF